VTELEAKPRAEKTGGRSHQTQWAAQFAVSPPKFGGALASGADTRTSANAAGCPQLVEADIRPLREVFSLTRFGPAEE
jgi:hypothetical protein